MISEPTLNVAPMSPLQASEFWPAQSSYADGEHVVVPDVDCGVGFRQLKWREVIEFGDEYFGGRDGDRHWVPVEYGIGDRYRPHTANSSYAPWSIIRRPCVSTETKPLGVNHAIE